MNKETSLVLLKGVLRSYSQIFFSESYWFAIPLVLVSFLDVSAGLSGLLSVVTANLIVSLLKFDKFIVAKGFYGYNSLLVGLGLGYYYELTLAIIVIAILAGFLTLLITIVFQGILGKYYLPYLSLPFVFSVWIVLSAGWMVSGTVDNQSGVYVLNKLFSIGGNPLVNLHHWWVGNITSNFLNNYFLSLGAIFFQFNVFAGIVVAIALLFYSRIAFLLSLLGYFVAYSAYNVLGMDMTQLGYSLIGFNFILGAIAIGGYFYIPSKQSFFWAFAITPIIALVAAGLLGLLKPFYLPILSLPFSFILLAFIYSLRYRTVNDHFKEVIIQEGTPERNLYSYQSFSKRFPNSGWIQIKLPFLGEWYINQGHDGENTHKGDWSHAWDFVIINSEKCQYSNEGEILKDYYCYGQKIIAPADGTIVVIEDGIEDNELGKVNLIKNWGNTVIIKHADGLFSKLCHLQKGSIEIKVGETVHYGQVIGKVGNSGRSPYPHLHFQLQATPYIGSKTLKYPLFTYLEDGKEIRTFSYPSKDQSVRSVEPNLLLKSAFNLIPGIKMNWSVKSPQSFDTISWEVFTNAYNKSYVYCYATKSIAYFHNDGVFFYFTHFEGDRKSLLYSFYLAAFRIPLIYIDGYKLTDYLPVNQTFNGWRLFLQDFLAPFYLYLTTCIEVSMIKNGSDFDLNSIEYHSRLSGYSFNNLAWTRKIKLKVSNDNSLSIEDQYNKIEAVCETY
ncbi:MAG: peptidase M23 [Bacteroidales bacterium]|nr:MAG: peptidase M23 [Bacteroidales bacterium]